MCILNFDEKICIPVRHEQLNFTTSCQWLDASSSAVILLTSSTFCKIWWEFQTCSRASAMYLKWLLCDIHSFRIWCFLHASKMIVVWYLFFQVWYLYWIFLSLQLFQVKKEEKNVRRTVLNSVVGTLDLSIRKFVQRERYPGVPT